MNAQERIAARIEERRFEGPRQLLRAAADAVQRNQWGRANELLERAETDVLNMRVARGMIDPELGRAGTGPGGAVVARIGEAREAVVRANPRRAMRQIDMALSRINDAQMFERRDRFARDRYGRDYQAGRDGRGMRNDDRFSGRDGRSMRNDDRFSGRYDNRDDMGASR